MFLKLKIKLSLFRTFIGTNNGYLRLLWAKKTVF